MEYLDDEEWCPDDFEFDFEQEWPDYMPEEDDDGPDLTEADLFDIDTERWHEEGDTER